MTRTRRSRRTATCSATRPRRRRSAAARANASSTSTRMRTGRGRCSSLRVSSTRYAPVRDLLEQRRRVAIVPAYNEEECIAQVLDELRAFDPGLELVVVDDGSVDRTSAVAHAKG